MSSADKYNSNLAFVDLLFNVLIGFVFLFIIAFLMINPVAKKADIVIPAEIIITMTWPDELDVDMDIWVKDPANNTVGYRRTNAGIMNLDRDDVGKRFDNIELNGELVQLLINREVVTLRGLLPGEYRVSVHLYGMPNSPAKEPIPVSIEVQKINPFSVIYKQTQEFYSEGQIKNYYKFTVDANGNIIDISDSLENVVPLVPGYTDRILRGSQQ
jgi:hypothetical protein